MDTGRTSNARWIIVTIWAMFLCKGVFYCLLFPVWEGYDEYAHFGFIQFVANHKELPVPESVVSREVQESLALVPLPWLLRQWPAPATTHDEYWRLSPRERSRREERLRQIPVEWQTEAAESNLYEGKQGPLYYWLMSPIHILFRHSGLPSRVLLFRVLNVFLASAIIPLAFVAARLFFLNEALAVRTCLLIAAMPELYIDSARVGNQTLSMLLYGVLTFLCLKALDQKSESLLAIGVTLGLLLLTKAYALAAVPVVGFIIFATRPGDGRKRHWLAAAVSLASAGLIAGWWYFRNFQLVGSLAWVDGAPAQPLGFFSMMRRALQVDWLSAADSLVGSHIWFGNWSFLAVRSWMYHVFDYLIAVMGIGLAVALVRHRSKTVSMDIKRLGTVGLLYGGFLAAIAYHVLVNFINTGIGASTGWYLYAVILPEALLVITSLRGLGKLGNGLYLFILGCLTALELYAAHWLLLPYYTGLISHVPSGALQSFHPGRVTITFAELLQRLQANRPPFITSWLLLLVWLSFVASTLGLFYLATYCFRKRTLDFIPVLEDLDSSGV
jgi:hypothetical protein